MDLNKYNQFRNSIKSKKSSSKKGKISKKQITLQSSDKELQNLKYINVDQNQEHILSQIQLNLNENKKPESLFGIYQNLNTETSQQIDQNEQFQNILQIESKRQTKNSKSIILFSDEKAQVVMIQIKNKFNQDKIQKINQINLQSLVYKHYKVECKLNINNIIY
ncbi:hypothetical protein ABPG72_016700 [Tetrahymena utriculariae]